MKKALQTEIKITTIYSKKNQHLKIIVNSSLNPTSLSFKRISHGCIFVPFSFFCDKSLQKKDFSLINLTLSQISTQITPNHFKFLR